MKKLKYWRVVRFAAVSFVTCGLFSIERDESIVGLCAEYEATLMPFASAPLCRQELAVASGCSVRNISVRIVTTNWFILSLLM